MKVQEQGIISFVIISFNRAEDTRVVVRNVLDLQDVAGFEKEIIVINNGSDQSYRIFDDFLAALAKEERALVDYVDNPENLGVARGRNLGISRSKGELLIFIDDDAEFVVPDVIPICFKKLEQYAERNIGIIAFREYRTKTEEWYIATKDKAQAKEAEFFTNYFVGSGHMVRREVFDRVGLYTTEFFYGMEEYDLAYKTIEAGYTILYTSEVTVHHHKNASGRAAEKTLTRWNLENKTVVAYKYLPLRYVFSHLFFWSAHFLKEFRFDVFTLFKAWRNIPGKISRTERQPISSRALRYIETVKGRLWY